MKDLWKGQQFVIATGKTIYWCQVSVYTMFSLNGKLTLVCLVLTKCDTGSNLTILV